MIDAFTSAGLTYRWLIIVAREQKMSRLHMPKLAVHAKPLLWFSAGKCAPFQVGFIRDLIKSTRPQKAGHDWEQSATEATYLIDLLAPPGGLVVDPFAGSGTTLATAKQLGRRYLGAELDPTHARTASRRLALARPGG